MRTAIYCRVSTDAQTERQTVEQQLVACREHAEALGWQVTGEFLDQGVSGTLALEERPEAVKLLAALEAKQADAVIIFCIDRLSRENLTGVPAYNRLRKLTDGHVEFVTQSIDDTPEGRLQFHMFMAIAEYEREQIAARTKRGRRASAAKGNYVASRVPYGLVRQDRQVELHPTRSGVIHDIFTMCADQDFGVTAIATRLKENGVEPPTKSRWGWTSTSVGKLLHNEVYAGRAKYGGEVIEVPAIVSNDLFQRAQDALARRRQVHAGAANNAQFLWILTNLVRCGHCGSRYSHAMWSRGKRKVFCLSRRRHGPAAGHENVKWLWDEDEFTDRVLEWMNGLTRNPEVFAEALECLAQDVEEQLRFVREELPGLEARLSTLDTKEDRLLDSMTEGLISKAKYVQKREQIRQERESVEAQVEQLRQAGTTEVSQAEKQAEIARTARELAAYAREHGVPQDSDRSYRWAEFPAEVRQLFALGFIKAITVDDDGLWTIKGTFPVIAETRIYGSSRDDNQAMAYTARLSPTMV